MRIPFQRLIPLVCLLGALAGPAHCQEPTPEPTPAPVPEVTTPAPETPPEPTPRRRPRRPAVVIEAGTVHPVAGPAIADGVVVIRGERIVGIGKRGEVEVPENAVVRSFPTGHAYPGLVDAATDAFTDSALRGDAGLDAGDALADVLLRRHDREDELARAGITTAYVTLDTPALLRGQGAIVRPTGSGFVLWEGHERAGLGLRLTNGAAPGHALQRQQQFDAADALFEGLDEYRKTLTDHEEALTKYRKEFDEYLTWHRNKQPKEGDAAGAKPTTTAEPAPEPPKTDTAPRTEPGEGGRRRRGGPPRDGAAELLAALENLFAAAPQDPPKQDPKPAPADAAAPEQPADGTKKPDESKEGPKRPSYPKAPAQNPQKDVLLRVLDGELPLRVEAHRADELRAALRLQETRTIPVMVVERAHGADKVADQLALHGIPAVLTDVLPDSLPPVYEDFDPTTLPAQLQRAGVAFAIASGSGRRADVLRLMAATAIGGGLDADAALRAITLTPAEILGVAGDTGSLAVGKFGDVLVCDRPLFQSDCRVLLVLGKGRAEYEAN